MCAINNASGYAAGTSTAMTSDDFLPSGDVRTVIPVGLDVWAKNPAQNNAIQFLGKCTAVTATSVRIGAGTKFAINDNAELYVVDPANLAYTLASGRGYVLADPASAGLEVSDDGRGNITYTFFDFS